MGLRADVQTALAEALDAEDELADTVEDFTASRTTISDTYDPETGTYPETVTTYAGRWIRDEWTRQELDSQHIEATDIKRIILQNEQAYVPAVDDTVGRYRVVDFMQDGAEATWTVQLRKA